MENCSFSPVRTMFAKLINLKIAHTVLWIATSAIVFRKTSVMNIIDPEKIIPWQKIVCMKNPATKKADF